MNDPGRLPALRLVALSLPTLVFAGYELARRSFLPTFLTADLGLSIGAVGWLVTMANFASIPAELAVGALGDRTAHRFGRRTPWMILGTSLVLCAGGGLLWSNTSSPVIVIAAALSAFVMGWAICNVTHGAWALELARDGRMRVQVFGWRTLAGIVGGIGFSAIAVAGTVPGSSPFWPMLATVLVAVPLANGLLLAMIPDVSGAATPQTRSATTKPLRVLFAHRDNRQLAMLFALNGAHTAITSTGYLYIADYALALPEWGATGILVQTIAAAIGVLATIRFGARWPAARLLAAILWANLFLAIALIGIPAGRPAPFMLWSTISGLVSAIDFIALRTLLGARLEAEGGAASAGAHAAAYYAGFHLPFNLCGAAAVALLFALYHRFGFDPNHVAGTEQTFVPVVLIPSGVSVAVTALSLWLLRRRPTVSVAGVDPDAEHS